MEATSSLPSSVHQIIKPWPESSKAKPEAKTALTLSALSGALMAQAPFGGATSPRSDFTAPSAGAPSSTMGISRPSSSAGLSEPSSGAATPHASGSVPTSTLAAHLHAAAAARELLSQSMGSRSAHSSGYHTPFSGDGSNPSSPRTAAAAAAAAVAAALKGGGKPSPAPAEKDQQQAYYSESESSHSLATSTPGILTPPHYTNFPASVLSNEGGMSTAATTASSLSDGQPGRQYNHKNASSTTGSSGSRGGHSSGSSRGQGRHHKGSLYGRSAGPAMGGAGYQGAYPSSYGVSPYGVPLGMYGAMYHPAMSAEGVLPAQYMMQYPASYAMVPVQSIGPDGQPVTTMAPVVLPAGTAGMPMTGGVHGGARDAATQYQMQYNEMLSYMQHGFTMHGPAAPGPQHQQGFGGNAGGRQHSQHRGGSNSLDIARRGSSPGSGNLIGHRQKPSNGRDVEISTRASAAAAASSALLEEFRAWHEAQAQAGDNNNQPSSPTAADWDLDRLQGHLKAFCRDQYGSRVVQKALEDASPDSVYAVFKEVKDSLSTLMTDLFANYVIQKCLELGDERVSEGVTESMKGKVMQLSLQTYGCRVLQKLLEVCSQRDRVALCAELTEHTLRCVQHQNGNHVIQKCIEFVQPSDAIRPMAEIICGNVLQLSMHAFGCRLVQRLLEYCTLKDIQKRATTEILASTTLLAYDQYGNYVIQHLVEKGPELTKATIFALVAPDAGAMSQHKFASNVIEACLKHGTSVQRALVLGYLLAADTPLHILARQKYGNYVVQRGLEVAEEPERGQLLVTLRPHLEAVKKHPNGRHCAQRVEAMLRVDQGLSPAPSTSSHASHKEGGSKETTAASTPSRAASVDGDGGEA